MDDIRQTLRAAGQDGIPKYLLLRNYLAEEIAKGRIVPGARLPAEDALAEMAAMSLGTVQRSLRMLVQEGLLVRKHGTGTFVAEHRTMMQAPFQHCRFVDDETNELLPIYSQVVRREVATGAGPWSAHLPDGRIICLERLFSIANEFTIYTHLYFDGAMFPELVSLSIDRLNGANLKDLLAREWHHPPSRYTEHLSIRPFPEHVCRAVSLKPQTSGAVLEIRAFDRQGGALYFQDLYIPPNRRRLLITG